jgi:hypothetical protein
MTDAKDLSDISLSLQINKAAPVDANFPLTRVAFYDTRSGRFLSASTVVRSVSVVFGSGIVTPSGIFNLRRCVDGSTILQLADLSAYIGLDIGNGYALCLVHNPEHAAPFELVDSSSGFPKGSGSISTDTYLPPADANVSLRLAGTRLYVISSTEKQEEGVSLACIGRAGESGASLAFVLSPLLASTNVRWTVTQMHEKLICLWGGSELGWCTAHPTKLFNLGGEVTSRDPKLGEWQCFTIIVLNAKHNLIALRSSHGFFLCAESDGRMVANRKVVDAWETFELVQADSSTIALRTSHRTIVSLQSGKDVVHKSKIISDFERLVLFCGASAKAQYYNSNPAGKVPSSLLSGFLPGQGILLGSLAVAGVVAGSIAYAALVTDTPRSDNVASLSPEKGNAPVAPEAANAKAAVISTPTDYSDECIH